MEDLPGLQEGIILTLKPEHPVALTPQDVCPATPQHKLLLFVRQGCQASGCALVTELMAHWYQVVQVQAVRFLQVTLHATHRSLHPVI